MTVRIKGTTNLAEVDAGGNLNVNPPLTSSQAGFTALLAESDKGVNTGTRLVRELEATEDYRLRVGIDNLLFNEVFPNNTLNSGLWMSQVTTMATAVAAGFLTLNSAASVASANAMVRSYRHFPVFGTFPLYGEFRAMISYAPMANSVTELGFGLATGVAAPTDGVFFRLYANGDFRCVMCANSVETPSANLNFNTLIGVNTMRHFCIRVGEDSVAFWVDDQIVARITVPTTGYLPTASQNLPMFFRTYNTGSTGTYAQQVKIATVIVTMGDMNSTKPYGTALAGMGQVCHQTPTTGAAAVATCQWPNNALPTVGTVTNTTATCPAGLGGIFYFNFASLTGLLDYDIQSYQVPLGSVTYPGRSLYVKGVRVSTMNYGVASAASVNSWGIALTFGSTAVSLAVAADTAVVKYPRRVPLGFQSLAASAAVGVLATPDIQFDFGDSPLCIQPGEWLQTLIKPIVYTSTTSQTLIMCVAFNGYWE